MKRNVSRNLKEVFAFALTFAFMSILSACSNDEVAGGSSDDAGIYAIKDLDVAGLAQKGPFVKGSVVTVQGVDCKTMKFTEEKFEGEVKNSKGDFGVDDVNLSASCALFAVSGYYMNEVTGEKSSDKLTLHAITDLSDRKSVNINVLTELEYERVMNLVSKNKMTFADAKLQAEKEILASLGVMNFFESFEGLNIYEKGDGNATLLATSVLLQSDLDAKKLSDRMDGFASSIAETGEWNDDKVKTKMADWASTAKTDGKFDFVRENLEKWSGSDDVPEFEKVVDEINKDAKNSTQEIPEGWSWDVPLSARLNPNIKYDTMIDPRDKQVYKVVKIEVKDQDYSQVWMAENLNYADSVKTPSLKGQNWCYMYEEKNCKVGGRYYTWAAAIDSVALANDSKEPLDCGFGKTCGLDRGVQGICPDGWHLPTAHEWGLLSVALGNAGVAGDSLKALTGWDYAGTDDNNGQDAYGFSALPTGRRTNPTTWEKVGSDVYYWSSNEAGENLARYSNINNIYTKFYLFQNLKSYGQSVRCIKGDASTAAIKSSSSSSVGDAKSSNSSVTLATPCKTETEDNCEYGSLTDFRDGQTYKTVKIGDMEWMAENLNYAYLQPTDGLDSTSFCYNDSLEYCETYGRLYTWAAVVDSAGLFSSQGMGCGYYAQCTFTRHIRGVCPEGWHVADTTEWQTLIAMVSGDRMTAGRLLKSSSGWKENNYGTESNGVDAFGFAVLPSGYRDVRDITIPSSGNAGSSTKIWTATDWNTDLSEYSKNENGGLAYYYTMHNGSDGMGNNLDYKTAAFPVRCVKD